MCTRLPLLVVAVVCAGNPAAHGMPLAVDGRASAVIVLADDPIPAETTAAKELAHYLGQVTGAEFRVVRESEAGKPATAIFVGPTAAARKAGVDVSKCDAEQWIVRTVDNGLVLAGGRPRGTIYAVYRFLEDIVGVRWWNPFEEHVPKQSKLEIGQLDRSGKPRFGYRDIYLLYSNDGGRFAARHRVNGQGFGPIDTLYGSGVYYGPPGGVHTFYPYVGPKDWFEKHPEWFSLIGGKRVTEHGQLCLTNRPLREEVLRRAKEFITQGQAAAAKAGRPVPVDFDISQNDWHGWCQCDACKALVDREGSQSGPLLDFLNEIATAVAKEHPRVRINTLAYQMSEEPPRTIRPAANIVPRLCDTNANLLQPITHADNRPFAERVVAWGRMCKHLRIWDYAVTYRPYYGLPLPTLHTYAPDYRYFAEHNVEGVFTEHEYPLLADLRDLKIYMMMKLLEDPYRDPDALLADFSDGFYGPAGVAVRRYLKELQAAADETRSNVNWFPTLGQYKYLTLPLLIQWQALFDQAEKSVAGDAVRLRRVRHARLPVDRAVLVLWPKLVRQWMAENRAPDTLPLARDAIAARCRQTWFEQIDLRFAASQRAKPQAEAEAELGPLLARRAVAPLPEQFRKAPPKDLFDFTPEQSNNWKDQARRVDDPQSECGITNRLELSGEDMKRYKLPMPWGLYDPQRKRGLGSAQIKPSDVPGPGYHWYKLGTYEVPPTAYVYFFWSWIIQFPLDNGLPTGAADARYEIWSRVKFEGPDFPHGKADQKNAICVERVILVRQ